MPQWCDRHKQHTIDEVCSGCEAESRRKREFDPKSEKHFPLLIIKAVEPGCTTELQIEDVINGDIVRLTTTDDEATDDQAFREAILAAWLKVWHEYCGRG